MKLKMKNIYLPTANEQISIPTLYTDGRIESINFISMRQRGLIEIVGDSEDKPLIKPLLRVNGKEVKADFEWERKSYWIPAFHMANENMEWNGEIVAPIGERGFYYHMKVMNKGDKKASFDLGMEGCWAKTLHTINESKEINASPKVFNSNWNNSFLFELMGEIPLFSFAPVADKALDEVIFNQESTGSINYHLLKKVDLNPNEETAITFFWGLGLEEVGAATAAKEMHRKGIEKLRKSTVDWLNKRTLTTEDQALDEIMNLNLFFNLFFSTGKTLDTEEYVWVTSRSPRYYVSASYWDRDSLLWSFPAILTIDTKFARTMLDYVFTTQKRNIGIHSRYIDGIVLEPGFELDELCAPIIALNMYGENTNDWEYTKEKHVEKAVAYILDILKDHRHSEFELYDTFLQPTDDPIVYPYLTYNNVLVWKVFSILADINVSKNRLNHAEYYKQKAEAIKKDIYKKMVVEYKEKKIFAWSVDLEGNYNLYDEPPGSLQLLPYYGFCKEDDPIYLNTMDFIRSDENSYSFNGYAFDALGCDHANHPWILSIANDLLSGGKEHAKELILKAPMDGGIACESIDEHTGVSRTGEHFATCAGFLTYSIYKAFGTHSS